MTPAQVAHIMPPLPKPLTLSRGDEDGAIQLGYTAEQMQAYARAAVEAALRDAPQAEPKEFRELMGHLADVLDCEAFDKIDTDVWNAASRLVGIANLTKCATPSAPTAVEPDERETERIALMSLFNFMQMVFTPMTPQQREIKKQLDITDAAIRAARASKGTT